MCKGNGKPVSSFYPDFVIHSPLSCRGGRGSVGVAVGVGDAEAVGVAAGIVAVGAVVTVMAADAVV